MLCRRRCRSVRPRMRASNTAMYAVMSGSSGTAFRLRLGAPGCKRELLPSAAPAEETEERWPPFLQH